MWEVVTHEDDELVSSYLLETVGPWCAIFCLELKSL